MSYLKVIVGFHFTGQFVLEPVIPRASTVLIKDPLLSRQSDQTTAVALHLEKVAQTGIVACPPKDKQDQKEPLLDRCGQSKEEQDLDSHDNKRDDVKDRLALRYVKDLCDHILCHWHPED